MTDRNAGIGHRAARSLIEEITHLREDIHYQGELLKRMELLLTATYAELHHSNRATAAGMLE